MFEFAMGVITGTCILIDYALGVNGIPSKLHQLHLDNRHKQKTLDNIEYYLRQINRRR